MPEQRSKNTGNKTLLMAIILLNYFSFAMITNVTGVLFGYWQEDFSIDQTSSKFLSSAFFIAYALTSLPQGLLLEKIGNKKTFLWAFSLIFTGSLLFALSPSFSVGLLSLFLLGVGVTAMQIVGNLLVKSVDDDPNKYSRNLTLAQVFTGIGSFSGGALNKWLSASFVNFHWTAFYYIFAGLILVLGALVMFSSLPESQPESSSAQEDTSKKYITLLTNPLAITFALGIFTYVGIEVGIANWIQDFLTKTHRVSVENAGMVVAWFWGLQSIGRLSGGVLLNFIESGKALSLYGILALLCLFLGVFSSSEQLSSIGFVGVGFFTSIMFPTIFSIAINKFDSKYKEAMAGLLCTAIVGGAFTQVIIGYLAQQFSDIKLALIIAGGVSFAYIACLGILSRQNAAQQANQ